MPPTSPESGPGGRLWLFSVAALAAVAVSGPLFLHGTPDVESYMLSVFSTLAFARNLLAGTDPWFAPGYGFGLPLPSSSWFLRFPLALPAAAAGAEGVYTAIWLGGHAVFSFYFLRIALVLTGRRGWSLLLLVTALFSFSNLGPTYVDDWLESWIGWALLPACYWHMARVLLAERGRERVKAAAGCAVALGIFIGSIQHNEMATFFTGAAVMLAVLLPSRPAGVCAVACASVVAVVAGADVLEPAVSGMLAGHVNLFAIENVAVHDPPAIHPFASFLEPLPAYLDGGAGALRESLYRRAPFFGAIAFALALAGAVCPFLSRRPAGGVPNDIARAIGIGFVACSALVLLPPWVMLNLPRMWTFRDGQTVLGLFCAAMAIGAIGARYAGALRGALALHLLQVAFVAAPIVLGAMQGDGRLFAYARRDHVLFDRLREAGVDGRSRLMLAGTLEDRVRGELGSAGVTATTDFALEGLPLVNAWYRGGNAPALGMADVAERHGIYETRIAWSVNLGRLDAPALDVLGITHVVVLEDEIARIPLVRDLAPAGAFALPDGTRIRVLRNADAWPRASLLPATASLDPPRRAGCDSATIYCRDYSALAPQLQARLKTHVHGSTARATLPPDHPGGVVLLTIAAGHRPTATVDGQDRPVEVVMGVFAAVRVKPDDRALVFSVSPTGRAALTFAGAAVLLAALAVALYPLPRRLT